MILIPKWRGYKMRVETVEIDDNGANSHRLIKVPIADVAVWDAEHDETGQLKQRRVREPYGTVSGG